MNVITPTKVTDANFVSSTVAEADYAVWSAATTYVIGNRVILTAGYHGIYESLQATNLNHHPVTDTSSPPYWKFIAPTNRWAMFDTKNSTTTSAASSVETVFAPGRIDAMYLAGLVGDTLTVSITNGPAGPVVYSKTVGLVNRYVGNWYDWFFADFNQLAEVALTDIPPYSAGVITLTVTGSGAVSVATVVAGRIASTGGTEYGAEGGIIDYSRKETDPFGNTTFVERPYSRRSSMQITVANAELNRVTHALNALRATPAVYLGSDDPRLGLLNVFGFYRGYRTVVSYPDHSVLSIDLEGLT